MCESMQAIREDFASSYSCTLTNDECTELQCVKNSVLESLTMSISQCDDPPTVTLKVVVDNRTYTMAVTSPTSRLLDHTGIVLTVGLWSYDYSIDLEVSMELQLLNIWSFIEPPFPLQTLLTRAIFIKNYITANIFVIS